MQKIIRQLTVTCNWLLFLEVIYALWASLSLFSIFSGGSADWKSWASCALYISLIYLFATLKNKVTAFREYDEESLRDVDPTAIIPAKFSNTLLFLFALQVFFALILAAGPGFAYLMFLFQYVDGSTILFVLGFFIMPLAVIILGVRLYILMIKLKRFRTSITKLSNI